MTTTTEKAPARRMSPERTAPRRFTTLHTRQWMWAALFLLPSVLLLVLLRFAPMASAVTEAFSLGSERELLANFAFVFSDPAFWNSLQITLIFSLIVNPLQIGLALGLAVLLTKKIPLVGLWRTLILIPVAVPQVVSAIIWLVLFRPDGPLNGIARALGLPSVPWLTEPGWSLWSIIVVCSWVGVGYWMTFLVAGIREIPDSLYEASSLDGAGGWRQFCHITLPGLRRPLLFVLVADTVSNFLIFAPVRIMTRGGPEGSSDLIMFNITERAYTLGDTGAASAATLVLIFIVVTVVALQFRLLPGKD